MKHFDPHDPHNPWSDGPRFSFWACVAFAAGGLMAAALIGSALIRGGFW